jgi:calcineurin-like phosphoesterase family protein
MSNRFFTSDFHLSDQLLIDRGIRSFKSAELMNEIILKNCNQRCKCDDMIIHCGDFYCYKGSRGSSGGTENPMEFMKRFDAMLVNVRGNHDGSNKVKSFCDSMRTTLGKKYLAVSVGHYPSTNPLARGTFHRGDIRIHGHIHYQPCEDGTLSKPPKYFIDFENKVLNINVNCELWNYTPVSEDELIVFVDRIMRTHGR